MGLVTVSNGTDFAVIKEIIDRDGGVIIENYASLQLMDDMAAALEPYFEGAKEHMLQFDNAGVDFFPKNVVHVYGTIGKAPETSVALLQNPHHQQIMDHGSYSFYIGDEHVTTITGWQLNTCSAMRVGPGAEPQVLHRDHTVHPVPHVAGTTYTSMVGCLIAGTDATEANGATRVIPGSHRWPITRRPKAEETVPAEMKKGSALFWLGSVYHGAGRNTLTVDQPKNSRLLYGFFGCRDWVRAEENQQVANPWETVKDLPAPILAKLGWAKAAGGCGFVDLGQ
ncbi:hypothetical protein JCM24511_05057 [Saitozyma sp. JCM 24511]|nr:hypothetical protein JCM24511_05057 [Saitozyma sp. JCM 24511]